MPRGMLEKMMSIDPETDSVDSAAAVVDLQANEWNDQGKYGCEDT